MNDYEKERANMLAAMEYVGFAADIYGVGTPVESMQHWMATSGAHRGNATLYMSKINAAIAKVKTYDYVDTTKIAVIGYCFGGTGIVNMAILGTDVLGVVGYHSGIAPTARAHVSTSAPVAIKPKVLLHSGAMDDKAADVAALEQELEKGNATYEIIRYGKGVVHSFTEWSSKTPGMAMYDERADYRSWESTKMFLTELFSGMPTPAREVPSEAVTKALHNYTCDGGTCQGYLAYKKATCTETKKCLAVVVIQDWNGMNDYEKERSNMLAGMDYVGFAADIYGLGTPSETMFHWMAASGKHRGNATLYMAKITAALDKVKSLNFVDATKIAVIGYCFGGTGIINMALMGSDVLGVVGYHSGLTGRVMYDKKVTVKAKVLIHSGVMDDKAENISSLESDLEDAKATYEIARYGKNVFHSFTEWSSKTPGQAMYDARADYRSWESTKLFLHELFKGMPAAEKGYKGMMCPKEGNNKDNKTDDKNKTDNKDNKTDKKPVVSKSVLKGSLTLTVPNATAFLTDTVAKNAVIAGIASFIGVEASEVTLIVSMAGGRRLAAHGNGTAGDVKIDYTVTATATKIASAKATMTAATDLTALSSAVSTKVVATKGSTYAVVVKSKTAVTVTAATTSAPTSAGTTAVAAAAPQQIFGTVITMLTASALMRW